MSMTCSHCAVETVLLRARHRRRYERAQTDEEKQTERHRIEGYQRQLRKFYRNPKYCIKLCNVHAATSWDELPEPGDGWTTITQDGVDFDDYVQCQKFKLPPPKKRFKHTLARINAFRQDSKRLSKKRVHDIVPMEHISKSRYCAVSNAGFVYALVGAFGGADFDDLDTKSAFDEFEPGWGTSAQRYTSFLTVLSTINATTRAQ